VLARGAPDDVLVRAAAANQTAWLSRTAEAAGGVVSHEPGVTWMASVAGAVLAFPRISRKRIAELLPRFLDAGRAAGAPEASCWSLVPTTPRDLDDALQHSGFRTGWDAHWMAVEISERRPGLPAGLRVDLAPPAWEPTELPWDGAGIAMVRRRLAASTPRMVWHLGAWRGDAAVGHALVNVSRGRLGVAGVYEWGSKRASVVAGSGARSRTLRSISPDRRGARSPL
jgi:hypothetical protein